MAGHARARIGCRGGARRRIEQHAWDCDSERDRAARTFQELAAQVNKTGEPIAGKGTVDPQGCGGAFAACPLKDPGRPDGARKFPGLPILRQPPLRQRRIPR